MVSGQSDGEVMGRKTKQEKNPIRYAKVDEPIRIHSS
jgi:hypothetical protein